MCAACLQRYILYNHTMLEVEQVPVVQYCEFSPDPTKCYEWMRVNLPEHYSRIEASENAHVLLVLSLRPFIHSCLADGGCEPWRGKEADKRYARTSLPSDPLTPAGGKALKKVKIKVGSTEEYFVIDPDGITGAGGEFETAVCISVSEGKEEVSDSSCGTQVIW